MKSEKYKSLLVIVTGFAFLYLVFREKTYGIYLLYIALFVGLSGIFIPFLANYILIGWEKLAEALGWVNSRILLSVIFFVFLFPFALLSRLFGNNNLQLRKPGKSIYAARDHTYTAKDLENIW